MLSALMACKLSGMPLSSEPHPSTIQFQISNLNSLPASPYYTQSFRFHEPPFIVAIGLPPRHICQPRAGENKIREFSRPTHDFLNCVLVAMLRHIPC